MPRLYYFRTLILIPVAFFLLASGSVYAQLRAGFTADHLSGCAPLKVQFTNTSKGVDGNTRYEWDFGNGNGSSLKDAGAIYHETGTYSVRLRVVQNGETSEHTQTVTLYPPPEADFTVAAPKVCMPDAVVFNANVKNTGGSIVAYHWDLGDGSTRSASSPNLSYAYNAPQKPVVSLTVTNSLGCSHTIVKADPVEVLPHLNIGFTASETVLCKETDPVSFSNTSNGPGNLRYTWDFGDGNVSNEKDPSHSFNKKGTYSVKLKVESSEGCVRELARTNYLNVADFRTTMNAPTLLCTNAQSSFSATPSVSPASTTWEVNGTQVGYSYNTMNYNFQQPGEYTVKLNQRFGNCPVSVSKKVIVHKTPSATAFDWEILDKCGAPAEVAFKANGEGASKWEWDFEYSLYSSPTGISTRENPTYVYSSQGYRYVYLKVTSAAGCVASSYKEINIASPSVEVYVKGGSNSHINNCEEPISHTFTTRSSQEISSYKWTFSEGAASTEKEPFNTFTQYGNHFVRLDYTTSEGCTGTAIRNNMAIYRQVHADFTISANDVCPNTPITLTSTTENATDYFWAFQSHSNPISKSPTVTYAQAGTYYVTLMAYNGGCSATKTVMDAIRIKPPSVQNIEVVNTCEGTRGEVVFKPVSDETETMRWNFGDGSPEVVAASGAEVKHTYTQTGSYSVRLTGTNAGCTSSISRPAYVLLKSPITLQQPASVCIEDELPVTVSGFGTNPRGNSFGHSVRFVHEDNSSFSGNTYADSYYWTNTYNGRLSDFPSASFKIKAISTSSGFGCVDETNTVTVQLKGSSASFEVLNDDQCFGSAPVIFKDKSTTAGAAKINSWNWTLGDGTNMQRSTGADVSHAYLNPGNFYATLRITDDQGCTSTSQQYNRSVQVNGPKAQFSFSTPNEINQNQLVYFYNNSVHSGSYDAEYEWYINDELVSTSYSHNHRFMEPGNYEVKLVASSATTGCRSEERNMITVKPFNYAFRFNTSLIGGRNCPPALVQFQNTSVNYARVEWDFGDGQTLGNHNSPSHIYKQPGKYIVRLSVYSPTGLTGVFEEAIEIGVPEVELSVNETIGCLGKEVVLEAETEAGVQYTWDFGDGYGAAGTSSNNNYQYNSSGFFTPSVLVTDKNGCRASVKLDRAIEIRPDPVITLNPGKTRLCLGETTEIAATGADNYVWSAAAGLDQNNTATVRATPEITSTYTVLGTDDIGCEGSADIRIEVVQPQKIALSGASEICFGEETVLRASGTDQYQWINETAGLNQTNIPSPIAKPDRTISYTVVGSDRYSCFTDEASITIRVNPLPEVDAGPDKEVLAGNAVTLETSSSGDVTRWEWSPTNYLSCNNCGQPVATPLAPVTYAVKVFNASGCTASDTVKLNPLCEAQRVAIPNAFTPNGDGKNDLFIIKGIGYVKHLTIFGRYGDKVFERTNAIASENGWDGNIKGVPAPAGTYVYFIEMECPNGGLFTRKGTLTLIR